MARKKQSTTKGSNPPEHTTFRHAVGSGYKSTMLSPVSQRATEKAQEHGEVILNLGELTTVSLTAGITAEVNHTRKASNVWLWRMMELGGGGVVLGFNGTRNTLGRLGLGVFVGALTETLVDSTPGLTGQAVRHPPKDAVVYYKEI